MGPATKAHCYVPATYIHFLADDFQMKRIYAVPHPAEMIALHTGSDRAIELFIEPAMSQWCGFTNLEMAVAI